MADEIEAAVPASVDSASVADAAPDTGPTAESAEATHPRDGTTDGATADSSDDDEDGDEEASSEDTDDASQTEEQRKLSRSERRKAREAERVAALVQQELTREREASEAKARAEKAEADARAQAQAWQKEFGSYVGTREQRESLAKEIDDLISQTVSGGNLYEADAETVDRLNAARETLAAKRAELNRLNQNAATYQKLDEYQFQQTQHLYAARADRLPAEHRAAYLASTDLDTVLNRLEAGIVAREAAKHAAELAAVRKTGEDALAKERTAHEYTRNGGPASGPAPNGTNGIGSGSSVLTPERYVAMSFEDRQKLRSTPEGRAQIDQMTRSRTGFGQRSA